MAKRRGQGFKPAARQEKPAEPAYFDLDWVRELRESHPDLWQLGGPEDSWQELERQIANPEPDWQLERRQKWLDCRDYNTAAGYLHLLRWGLIADSGEAAMREAIDSLRGMESGERSEQIGLIQRQGDQLVPSGFRALDSHARDFDFEQTREAQTGEINEEARTVSMSFSSEAPVQRGYWYPWFEVLGHDPGEADISRLNNAGPYLWAHDPRDQRGVIESAWVEGGRGYCVVRLSETSAGEDLWTDIRTKIKRNVSFAYLIHEAILVKQSDDGDTYRATRWEALEVSSVSIPADPGVGVGRSRSQPSTPPPDPQPLQVLNKGADMAPPTPTLSNDSSNAQNFEEALQRDRERCEAIRQLGTRFNAPEALVRQFERENTSVQDAVLRFGQLNTEQPAIRSNPVIDLDDKEKRQYNLGRAILSVAKRDRNLAGFEWEISNELCRTSGYRDGGLMVPTNAGLFYERNQLVGTATAGGNLVDTQYRPNEMIELLRNSALTPLMGMRVLEGLTGPLNIPRQTGAGTAAWVGENTTIPTTALAVGLLAMRPRKLAAIYQFSEEMLMQANPSINTLIAQDITEVLGREVDRTVFYGSGLGEEPRGIASTPGISSVVMGTNGGPPTWDAIVNHETLTNQSNALATSSAYVTNPRVLGGLKRTLKGANTGAIYLVGEELVGDFNMLNGRRLGSTNQIRGDRTKGTGTNLSDMFFGDFSQIISGTFQGLVISESDSHANNFALDMIAVKARLFMDLGVRQPTAFSVCTDLAIS